MDALLWTQNTRDTIQDFLDGVVGAFSIWPLSLLATGTRTKLQNFLTELLQKVLDKFPGWLRTLASWADTAMNVSWCLEALWNIVTGLEDLAAVFETIFEDNIRALHVPPQPRQLHATHCSLFPDNSIPHWSVTCITDKVRPIVCAVWDGGAACGSAAAWQGAAALGGRHAAAAAAATAVVAAGRRAVAAGR